MLALYISMRATTVPGTGTVYLSMTIFCFSTRQGATVLQQSLWIAAIDHN